MLPFKMKGILDCKIGEHLNGLKVRHRDCSRVSLGSLQHRRPTEMGEIVSSIVVVQGMQLANDRRVISGMIRIPEVLEKFRDVEALGDSLNKDASWLMKLTSYANGLSLDEKELCLAIDLVQWGLLERLMKRGLPLQGLVGVHLNNSFVDFLTGKISEKALLTSIVLQERESTPGARLLVKKRIHWSEVSTGATVDEALEAAKTTRRIDELIFLGPQIMDIRLSTSKTDSISLDGRLNWFFDSMKENRSLLA